MPGRSKACVCRRLRGPARRALPPRCASPSQVRQRQPAAALPQAAAAAPPAAASQAAARELPAAALRQERGHEHPGDPEDHPRHHAHEPVKAAVRLLQHVPRGDGLKAARAHVHPVLARVSTGARACVSANAQAARLLGGCSPASRGTCFLEEWLPCPQASCFESTPSRPCNSLALTALRRNLPVPLLPRQDLRRPRPVHLPPLQPRLLRRRPRRQSLRALPCRHNGAAAWLLHVHPLPAGLHHCREARSEPLRV
jgi:hypothetical protein